MLAGVIVFAWNVLLSALRARAGRRRSVGRQLARMGDDVAAARTQLRRACRRSAASGPSGICATRAENGAHDDRPAALRFFGGLCDSDRDRRTGSSRTRSRARFCSAFMAFALCVVAGYMHRRRTRSRSMGRSPRRDSGEAAGQIVGTYSIRSPLPFWTALSVTALLLGVVLSPTLAVLGILAVLGLAVAFLLQSR